MLRVHGALPALLVLATGLVGCLPERTSPMAADHAWHVRVDSACLMVPNVITTNWDGINDQFAPVVYNVTSVQYGIRDAQLRPVYSHTGFGGWDGRLADGTMAPSSIYMVSVQATTTSGNTLRLTAPLRVVRHIGTDCLPTGITLVSPDMLDPRRCGELLPTNDLLVVCP
ncbi:MAG: hypothetical protein JNL52_15615 [Flavobacteriales bacterium]|nr:hypothetical protein [Flavobacteriales bacterium]